MGLVKVERDHPAEIVLAKDAVLGRRMSGPEVDVRSSRGDVGWFWNGRFGWRRRRGRFGWLRQFGGLRLHRQGRRLWLNLIHVKVRARKVVERGL
jgi:hypothetical protein